MMSAILLSAPLVGVLADPQVIAGRFRAPALEKEIRYELHLPPPDLAGRGSVPVLYFLHGIGDDEQAWRRQGFAQAAAEMMRRGEIPPMAVAIFDGRRGFYTNAAGGGPREEDAIGDFIAFVEEHHLGERTRGSRAIAGISMGGYGAVKFALKNPEKFAAAGSLSGSLRRSADTSGFGPLKRWYLRRIFGRPGTPGMREANDVFHIIQSLRASPPPDLFLACGSEDRYGFQDGAAALVEAARAARVPVEASFGPGEHDRAYWLSALPELLRFFGARLSAVPETGRSGGVTSVAAASR